MTGFVKAISRLRVGSWAKLERLEAEVAITEARLDKQAAANAGQDWLNAARSALKLASDSVADRRIEPGWKYLHEARRQLVFGYTDGEVEAAAWSLRKEATDKLRGWRQATVPELVHPILDRSGPQDADRRCRLAMAMQLRDEHDDNRYFKLRLVQRQVALLLWLFLAFLAIFAGFLYCDDQLLAAPGGTGTTRTLNASQLLAGMAVGALGACFSGLVSLAASSPDVSIPERIASTSVTFARPAIGAASALAAMLLLGAGLLGNLGTSALLAVAFAFGFSERLAIGALDRAAAAR